MDIPAIFRPLTASLAVTLLGLFLLLSPICQAATLHYEAPVHQAQWQYQQTPYSCELTHAIPGLGVAGFRRDALSDVGFTLQVEEALKAGGKALMIAEPPVWQPDLIKQDLGEVIFQPGSMPFRFGRALTLRILAELERGMQVTLYPDSWDAIPERVSITLSTVNIRPALATFRQCLAALPVFDTVKLNDSLVLFDTNSALLGAAAKAQLDVLSEYIKLNRDVRTIHIEAHTDNVASRHYNRRLSQQRAEGVRDYLLDKGVPANQVDLKYFGEERPAASNRNEQGRQQNRRVRIRVELKG